MDMTLNEEKLLSSTSWNEEYQHHTIDMTEDKYIVPFCLGLKS